MTARQRYRAGSTAAVRIAAAIRAYPDPLHIFLVAVFDTAVIPFVSTRVEDPVRDESDLINPRPTKHRPSA
jgi:hypothetical protein